MDPTEIVLLALVALALIGLTAGFVVLRRRSRSVGRELAAARRAAPAPPLAGRLAKSRQALGGALRAAFARPAVDDGMWTSLEEALIAADVGVPAAIRVVERVRSSRPSSPSEAARLLRAGLLATLSRSGRELRLDGRPAVVMVVGVNGSGKTTSIAKLAARLEGEGHSTLLGAADTFRAAADTQLRTWADRVGVEVVGGREGADPAAVAHDAYAAARARGKDVLIVDTAGRLHSRRALMDELGKIRRVLEREAGAIGEVLLVLDATFGQNAIAQARQFTDTAGVTGIILAKLDGTAKGGVVVAIEEELGIPVKLVGVGEGTEDLVDFDPEEFVDALLGEPVTGRADG